MLRLLLFLAGYCLSLETAPALLRPPSSLQLVPSFT